MYTTKPNIYIAIPHQRHAEIWKNPLPPLEENGDKLAEGDHDLHAILTIEEGLFWKGHQWARVQSLAERVMFEDSYD